MIFNLNCKEINKEKKQNFSLYFFAIFFCFLFFVKTIVAQEYELNDPRNPNCPCHHYQKMAEDEFQKKQQKQNNELLASNLSTEKKQQSRTKTKRKKYFHCFYKIKNRLVFNRTKKIKIVTNYSVCFKW